MIVSLMFVRRSIEGFTRCLIIRKQTGVLFDSNIKYVADNIKDVIIRWR